MRNVMERALEDLSNAFFRGAVALLAPKLCADLSGKKCWKRQNLSFDDLWWADFWPDLKSDQGSFFMTFDVFFECHLPRVATWPRSRVRGGGYSNTPVQRVRHRSPVRRGWTLSCWAIILFILPTLSEKKTEDSYCHRMGHILSLNPKQIHSVTDRICSIRFVEICASRRLTRSAA